MRFHDYFYYRLKTLPEYSIMDNNRTIKCECNAQGRRPVRITKAAVLFVGMMLLCGCGGRMSDNDAVRDTIPQSEVDLSALLPSDDSREVDSIEEWYRCRGPFASGRDTNEYKQCLYRLKRLVENEMDIPAKVLCDAAPRTEEEYLIQYRLTECIWVVETEKYSYSLINLDNMLWRYSMADSAGVMEAYLLFGEFVDGYVAESAYDNFIALEETLPAKFAKLRKERSRYWNVLYESWKTVMQDY